MKHPGLQVTPELSVPPVLSMGIVEIPANPSAPGHISVQLNLDVADVQSINRLLHQAASLSFLGPADGTTRQA